MTTISRADRYAGCLLGLACGDALGEGLRLVAARGRAMSMAPSEAFWLIFQKSMAGKKI